MRNLKTATKIDKNNYDKIVNNKKYDVVVFFIDTDYDNISLKISKFIYKISDKFKWFGNKSVLITYYDVNESGTLLYQENNYDKGDILIYPSYSKNGLKFSEKITVILIFKFYISY